jgi:hypothetical protein
VCRRTHDQSARSRHQQRRSREATKIIQNALGIENDDVANYSFRKKWPPDREHRARIIGHWLQTEAPFLGA